MRFALYLNSNKITSSSAMHIGRQQELQVSKAINENLHMRDKNSEPWSLTSQPRPQGGHPRARGNKAQSGIHSTNITITRTNMNTIVKLHIYNSQPRLAQWFTYRIINIGWRWVFQRGEFKTMPFRGLSSMPFRGILPMQVRGKQCLAPPHTSLCLPQCNQMITMFHNYNKILSTHGRVFSNSMTSPTNPFTPRLIFPPKGEWSLHTQYNNQSTM